MLKISNTKKTRFKMAIVLEMFFGLVVMYALYTAHPSVANTALGGMITIGTGYLLGESYRKSDKDVTRITESTEVETYEDPKDRLDI